MVTHINLKKITERVESYKIMEVTDYEGEIHLIIGIKYKVIVADTGIPILTTPHSTSFVLCETRVPIQYRGVHTPQSLTRQGILRYLNLSRTEILVVLTPPQKYV